MRLISLVLVLAATSASAQEFIHYKFDPASSTEVINYATGPAVHPKNGQLDSTGGPWTAGVFDRALAGVASSARNWVRTGWDPSLTPLTGDLTIAWFMRLGSTLGSSATYISGTSPGPNRLFVNGVAGRGLYQRNILASGGNGFNVSIPNDFHLPDTAADIVALATAGWVHVAIVVNATAQTADWYVNGISVLQLTSVVGGALLDSAGEYLVGGRGTSSSPFDIDEYIISRRAFFPPEIMALSRAPRAGEGPYLSGSVQCGAANLGSSGGRPSIGNGGYELVLNSTMVGAYVLALGASRDRAFQGALPLPLDLSLLGPMGRGCRLLADPAIALGGVTTGAPVNIRMPIPSIAELRGHSLFLQALVFSASAPAMEATPGWALGFGF